MIKNKYSILYLQATKEEVGGKVLFELLYFDCDNTKCVLSKNLITEAILDAVYHLNDLGEKGWEVVSHSITGNIIQAWTLLKKEQN